MCLRNGCFTVAKYHGCVISILGDITNALSITFMSLIFLLVQIGAANISAHSIKRYGERGPPGLNVHRR